MILDLLIHIGIKFFCSSYFFKLQIFKINGNSMRSIKPIFNKFFFNLL